MALDKGFSLLAEEGCIILMAADAAQKITVVGIGPVTFCLRVAEASFQPDFPAFPANIGMYIPESFTSRKLVNVSGINV